MPRSIFEYQFKLHVHCIIINKPDDIVFNDSKSIYNKPTKLKKWNKSLVYIWSWKIYKCVKSLKQPYKMKWYFSSVIFPGQTSYYTKKTKHIKLLLVLTSFCTSDLPYIYFSIMCRFSRYGHNGMREAHACSHMSLPPNISGICKKQQCE